MESLKTHLWKGLDAQDKVVLIGATSVKHGRETVRVLLDPHAATPAEIVQIAGSILLQLAGISNATLPDLLEMMLDYLEVAEPAGQETRVIPRES